jgi:1-acyl-sn-glycerol-3-phosphate acyltransferase
LATLTAFAYLIPATLILATLAILTSWIPPRGRGMLFFGRVWSRGLLAASRVRLVVEMDPAWSEAAGGAGGYVFMVNHQSYFDIPALLATVPAEVRFAAKRSLFRIPVFGWALAAGGFIPVDRKDLSQAREVFAAAAARLRSGASVLFFPEGTRSADGRLGAFQRGGFLVALKAGLPVVPVGIRGAREVMPRGRLSVRPGTIRLCYGAPVAVEGYGVRGRRELEAEIRRRIAELAECEETGEEPPVEAGA